MRHCRALQCWITAQRVSRTDPDAAWAARHPRRAAEEAALKRFNRAAEKDWGHKQAGTVQTHAHAAGMRQGALLRLYQSGAIDIHQLGAAQEIAAVAATIGAGLGVRMVSLETRVDSSRHGPDRFWESLGRVRAEWAYGRWRAELDKPGLVLAMVVEDCGLAAAARAFSMRKARARAYLVTALDLWPKHMRHARDQVSEAELLAAQAGLL